MRQRTFASPQNLRSTGIVITQKSTLQLTAHREYGTFQNLEDAAFPVRRMIDHPPIPLSAAKAGEIDAVLYGPFKVGRSARDPAQQLQMLRIARSLSSA